MQQALLDSCVLEHFQKWDAENRKSNAGRKVKVSYEGVLMTLLLTAIWGGPYSTREFADSVAHRMTPDQRRQIGITGLGNTRKSWEPAFWKAFRRLRRLIDPWHQTPLGSKLTGEQFRLAKDLYDHSREQRAHLISELLVAASVRTLPKKWLTSYQGDLAIDSTAIFVTGIPNPSDGDKPVQRDRLNGDFQCGWYTRLGDHDGTKVKRSKAAYECDTTVMIDAHGGDWDFGLTTGLYMHLPGEIKVGPADTIRQHAAQFPERGLVIGDRAFNNLNAHRFQEPIRRRGFFTAYDYRASNLGQQGKLDGKPVIIVDGVPYVDRMTTKMRQINRWHAEGRVNPDTNEPYTEAERALVIKGRQVYRMKEHGTLDADGNQRFSYPKPDPRTGLFPYFAYDENDLPIEDYPTGTVTVGLQAEVIRHLQKYEWHSPQWFKTYHQRNQVESSNKTLKDNGATDVGNRASRTGFGFAYTYLVVIMAVVAENLRRIRSGIQKRAGKLLNLARKALRRVRGRKDSQGQRLPHHDTERASSPPPGS